MEESSYRPAAPAGCHIAEYLKRLPTPIRQNGIDPGHVTHLLLYFQAVSWNHIGRFHYYEVNPLQEGGRGLDVWPALPTSSRSLFLSFSISTMMSSMEEEEVADKAASSDDDMICVLGDVGDTESGFIRQN